MECDCDLGHLPQTSPFHPSLLLVTGVYRSHKPSEDSGHMVVGSLLLAVGIYLLSVCWAELELGEQVFCLKKNK